MKRSAAIHNLGCKVNAYEAEAMQQLLEQAGYRIVPFEEKADVYIINTCSVTNIADRKSRQMLHRAKKMNPDAVVVAAGCYVQSAGEELLKDESVDIIVGNNRKNDIVKLIEEYIGDNTAADNGICDISCERSYEDMNISKTAEHARVFIKVQDGCNQFCSYCIIPYTRGRVRSRKPELIIEELTGLAKAGYKEVVLTGIHLSSYGIDFEEKGNNLIELIKEVSEIDGIERIRLGSLEPRIVTEEFAKELSSIDKICPHFHLSLQSGSAETLKRMNRHYTPEEYLKGCEILRKYFEHPAITTDVIAGFPGETEAEFGETLEFVKKVHFYEMHVFKYSIRKGTRAEKFSNQVSEQIKTERSHRLIKEGNKMSYDFRQYYIGKDVEVLTEETIERDGKKYTAGYTKEYVRAIIEGEFPAGQIIVKKAVSMPDESTLLLAP